MAKVRVLLDMAQSSSQLLGKVGGNEKLRYEQLRDISNLLSGLSLGMEAARANIQIGDEDGASASGVVTISSSGAQSVSVNGVALVGGTDYVIANLSASDVAANLASAIRNSPKSRVQAVLADASGATVVVVAKEAGDVGNMITISATGAAAASGANLVGGVDPSQRIYSFNRKA